MPRLALIGISGITAVAVGIMWCISALANFVHGFVKGGGEDPFQMLASIIAGNFESLNYMALLFGTGSIASDIIKASALILVGLALTYKQWGVALLAACIWLPAQLYSAYSVTGFVSQVMGDSIAKRERLAQQAKLISRTAESDVERLRWLGRQTVKGKGVSARRSRNQFASQYKEQRSLAQASLENLKTAPNQVAPDPAAALWQHAFKGWDAKDVSVASMIGLGFVIELIAGLGFFLLSRVCAMRDPARPLPSPPPAVVEPEPEIESNDVEVEPEPEPIAEKKASNVVDLEPPPRHIRGFRTYMQDRINEGRMESLPSQWQVNRAYRDYCDKHLVTARVNPKELREMLGEIGVESWRDKNKSRRIIYSLKQAA